MLFFSLTFDQVSHISVRCFGYSKCSPMLCIGWTVDIALFYRTQPQVSCAQPRNSRTHLHLSSPHGNCSFGPQHLYSHVDIVRQVAMRSMAEYLAAWDLCLKLVSVSEVLYLHFCGSTLIGGWQRYCSRSCHIPQGALLVPSSYELMCSLQEW